MEPQKLPFISRDSDFVKGLHNIQLFDGEMA